MAEIASVSAGVSCSDVFSSSIPAMSVWRENFPTALGQQNVVVFSCQLRWHVNLVSVSTKYFIRRLDSSRFLLIFVNRSKEQPSW